MPVKDFLEKSPPFPAGIRCVGHMIGILILRSLKGQEEHGCIQPISLSIIRRPSFDSGT